MRGCVAGSLAGIRCLRELRSNYNTPIGREQQDEGEGEGGRRTDGRTDEQTRRMKKATWQTENSRDAMRMQRKLKLLAKRCDARMKE